MSDSPRQRPYCWTTWLTGLLAGTDQCWYKTWYRTLHRYDKIYDPEREAFLAEWTVTHDELVAKRAAELRADGWEVRLEDDAAFKIVGEAADLAGKPDIVAIKGDDALVIDVKTGRPRESDHWQLLIYAFGLGLSWLDGKVVRCEVQYRDHSEPVRTLDEGSKRRIAFAVRAVSNPSPDGSPRPVPSAFECGRCDIAACKARYARAEGNAREYF